MNNQGDGQPPGYPPQGTALQPTQEAGAVGIEIVEHDELKGSSDVDTATKLYYAMRTGMRLRQVKITLQNAGVRLEAGALHYMKGRIQVENASGGMGGLVKKRLTSAMTGEGMFRPVYQGSGEVWLEPSFGHFVVTQLQGDAMIVDRGAFYACELGVEVSAEAQKNVGAALLGGEGLFQTRLQGTGKVVLALPVHPDELVRYELRDETLQVDGNFAFMRKGQVTFSVERSAKGLLGSMTSGEGLLQTFRGTGEVWIAPTASVYEQIRWAGVGAMMGQQNTSGSTSSGGLLGNILKGILS